MQPHKPASLVVCCPFLLTCELKSRITKAILKSFWEKHEPSPYIFFTYFSVHRYCEKLEISYQLTKNLSWKLHNPAISIMRWKKKCCWNATFVSQIFAHNCIVLLMTSQALVLSQKQRVSGSFTSLVYCVVTKAKLF